MARPRFSHSVLAPLTLALGVTTSFARADHTAEHQRAQAIEAQGGPKPDDTAEQQKAEATKAQGGPKANEMVRAKEGAKTALPSVAGRPVRRYAEQEILELGGNVTVVKADAFTQVGASPFFGWFFIDYVQLSLIPSIEYLRAANVEAKGRYSVLLEPSFHVQIVDVVFGFFGTGTGVAYETTTGFGLPIAPRTGVNLLIGGSGVLTMAFSYVYTATQRAAIADGSTARHTSALGFQLGYSVAW